MANAIPGSILRTDILSDEDKKAQARLIVSRQYATIIEAAESAPRSVTTGASKNIVQVMDLIKDAIEDYETRMHVLDRDHVNVVYQEPSEPIKYETISIEIFRREPGAFGAGKPFESTVKNYRPMLREETEDTEHPGYKRAVLGYYHDNVLRLTCWGLTNKSANARMLWLEEIMEQYMGYFRYSGTNRILYLHHPQQVVRTVSNSKLYGRPIDYFVRTETLRTVSEKELEVIYLNLALRNDENL